MTIEQRKIALINWITNLTEESVIDQIEVFRQKSLSDLPKEIISLLDMSDSANESENIEHTNSRKLLGRL
ncbi:MAG: hypothetical protein ABJH04_01415 [Cyclobacteriaceae bacterium]